VIKNKKVKITIIGSGPSALILASELNNEIFDINIFEKGNSPGRKFLVAGYGGFNLTHSEPPEIFIQKYDPVEFIKPYFNHFNNFDTRKWFENIGIKTFIGSSKRIYPEKGIKPNQVLETILKKIKDNKGIFHFNYEWIDFDENFYPVFLNKNKRIIVESDIVIFALGGGSWKITGSDGKWLDIFKKYNIETLDFEPSNCALKVDWEKDFLDKFEGKPVKNIAVFSDNKYVKGEFVITNTGVEGGVIYAHAGNVRKQLKTNKKAKLFIDLIPIKTKEEIIKLISGFRSNKSRTGSLQKVFNLDDIKIALLKQNTSKQEFYNDEKLAEKIKKLPLNISGMATLDEAISTVGGLSLKAVDKNLKIKKLPFHYAIGEMLDWDAPTGGYLLQASFSMGNFLAHQLNQLK